MAVHIGVKWAKSLLAVAVLGGIWSVAHFASRTDAADLSPTDIQRLATTVKSGEIVLFGTDSCRYCVQTKAWLRQSGFAFTECNLDLSADCERTFEKLGGKVTPFLLVRGRPMKNGFDAKEFLSLLREKS